MQQARLESEERLRRGLRGVVCVVGSQARLSDNTLGVLRPVFERVEDERDQAV